MKQVGAICMSLILILAFQLACTRSAPTPSNITLDIVEMPKILQKGETGMFVVKTAPGNTCNAGVGYRNKANKWITVEWPAHKADDQGICQWQWMVPIESLAGDAEFRVAAEQKGESRMLIPTMFCIEVCQP